MTDFLLLTLYSPLASWGDIALGELRGTWDRPSRSAVLGLVAAALGLERSDQGAHDALDQGYGVAVRLDRPGTAMVDYHTVQTVRAAAVRRAPGRSRGELLALGEPETMLTQRAYREDALATAALWARADAPQPLADLAEALRRPRFVLYAGRKANPLGLPLHPELVAADSLAAAFAGRAAVAGLDWPLRLRSAGVPEISHDPCEGFSSGLRTVRREVRRDAGAHRGRWQFAERSVEVAVPTIESAQ